MIEYQRKCLCLPISCCSLYRLPLMSLCLYNIYNSQQSYQQKVQKAQSAYTACCSQTEISVAMSLQVSQTNQMQTRHIWPTIKYWPLSNEHQRRPSTLLAYIVIQAHVPGHATVILVVIRISAGSNYRQRSLVLVRRQTSNYCTDWKHCCCHVFSRFDHLKKHVHVHTNNHILDKSISYGCS